MPHLLSRVMMPLLPEDNFISPLVVKELAGIFFPREQEATHKNLHKLLNLSPGVIGTHKSLYILGRKKFTDHPYIPKKMSQVQNHVMNNIS